MVAAVQAIMERSSWNAKVDWNDGSYDGLVSLVSVGNGKRTGGVFFMTPQADPIGGRLAFSHGYNKSWMNMFQVLPSAMKPEAGNISEQKGIHELHDTSLKIHLDKPSPAHTDGEIFDQRLSDFEFKIFPSTVPILVP